MEVPLELAFKDVQRTEAIDQIIEEKVNKLERTCDHIVSCRLTVERDQSHQRTGNPYRARLVVRVPPGHEIVAKRETSGGDMHERLVTVLNEVFEAAERQLKTLTERQQGHVKRHPEQEVMAVVARVIPEWDYGFLRVTDGTEIFFHRNSVLHNGFDRLVPGTGVRFEVEEGDKGPQASTVEIVEKPGPGIVAMAGQAPERLGRTREA